MPWKVRDTMTIRKDFVVLALKEDANIRELCRRFNISPKTGYKWIKRYVADGDEGLGDHSRRPKTSPSQTIKKCEDQVLAIRMNHPAWGGRKINKRLERLGMEEIPAPSTITDILRRNGMLDETECSKHKAWTRFERQSPNQLWQMDFKGHFPMKKGRCHPLTVLDDHSRYSIGLVACANERRLSVQGCLSEIFRRYGMPDQMLMDNGSPWGVNGENPYTQFTVWLLRLGITVSHGRPYHPQTQGKEERFHRTLKAEVLRYEQFVDIAHCQKRFDEWREIYNHQRPHEALEMKVPADSYRASGRSFPEVLPAIEYGPDDHIAVVDNKGLTKYQNRRLVISEAFRGLPVAFRTTGTDGVVQVVFCNHIIKKFDLRDNNLQD